MRKKILLISLVVFFVLLIFYGSFVKAFLAFLLLLGGVFLVGSAIFFYDPSVKRFLEREREQLSEQSKSNKEKSQNSDSSS